jgi:hypothetical protein
MRLAGCVMDSMAMMAMGAGGEDCEALRASEARTEPPQFDTSASTVMVRGRRKGAPRARRWLQGTHLAACSDEGRLVRCTMRQRPTALQWPSKKCPWLAFRQQQVCEEGALVLCPSDTPTTAPATDYRNALHPRHTHSLVRCHAPRRAWHALAASVVACTHRMQFTFPCVHTTNIQIFNSAPRSKPELGVEGGRTRAGPVWRIPHLARTSLS